MPAVHQGGQNYVVKKKERINFDDERQKGWLGNVHTYRGHQNEVHRSHWSTQAVIDGDIGIEDEEDNEFYQY